ncbi:hypothetical protein KKA66_00415, partial [Patescibacteria group bacterium]|nr:hypothetical protein [Patescibacteria group bacterium]
MLCPKCGFENPSDAKYCQKCANVFSSHQNLNHNSNINSDIQTMPRESILIEKEATKKPKNKNFKKIIIIIFGVIFVGVLAFAGYYYKDEFLGNKIEVKENLE